MSDPAKFVCPVCEQPAACQGRSETSGQWISTLYCHRCVAWIRLTRQKKPTAPARGEGEAQ